MHLFKVGWCYLCQSSRQLVAMIIFRHGEFLEQNVYAGCMLLPTANHVLRSCGGLEALNSTISFIPCGVKTSSG